MVENIKKIRIESDLLGTVEVPSDALYGAQTQRAIINFPVNEISVIGNYKIFINSILMIKIAAALTNKELGYLNHQVSEAIIKSAEQIIKYGEYHHFPVHYLHGGGGTSSNMNINEVLANKSEELLGGKRGEYKIVHPNDHVNMNQSTNDVIPTACHISIIEGWKKLEHSLIEITEIFQKKSKELESCPRIARTCLQDAVEISFSDLLDGYTGLLERSIKRINNAISELYSINIGGTIVGRKKDVPEAYFSAIIPNIRKVLSDSKYSQSKNMFDAAQNQDGLAEVSSGLSILARSLIKIAKDFRLMGSGPQTGFGEINLPPVQPGSSIMPGKVNPVIPEFLIQSCFQAIGLDASCQMVVDHGELDLNVWENIMVFNILDSFKLLTESLDAFNQKCLKDFSPVQAKNRANANTVIPVLTELKHKYGYSRISALWKQSGYKIQKVKQILNKDG